MDDNDIAAIKSQAKRRGRKNQAAEPPASDGQGGDEARDDAAMAGRQPVTCAECGETFPGVAAATERYYAPHGKPEGDEPTE